MPGSWPMFKLGWAVGLRLELDLLLISGSTSWWPACSSTLRQVWGWLRCYLAPKSMQQNRLWATVGSFGPLLNVCVGSRYLPLLNSTMDNQHHHCCRFPLVSIWGFRTETYTNDGFVCQMYSMRANHALFCLP